MPERPKQPEDVQGYVWCVDCKWSGYHSELIERYDPQLGFMGPWWCPVCNSDKIEAVEMDESEIPF